MNPTKNTYNTPQEILYSVCLAAWNKCNQHLQKFTELKALYTSAFVTNKIEQVQAAKQLPDLRQTLANRKVARINLFNSTKEVLDNWQLIKVYILQAFDSDMAKAKLDEAGASLYRKASLKNWSSVRSLIDTTNAFITANLDALTNNDNMPAGFQTTFLSAGNNCIEQSIAFANAGMQKEAATSTKIDANNVIYASVIEMLKDGQQVFKEDEAIKKQFTFNYLVSLYQAEGSASLKGYVLNNLGLPVQGASIVSVDQKYKATSNAKGRYRIGRMAEGTYTFTVTCPGYSPIEQVITLAAGTASTVNFEMINQMKKAA